MKPSQKAIEENMKNDGGQAFPSPNDAAFNGMSLRDAFALSMIQGILGRRKAQNTYEYYAEHAYRFADAMLAEREKDSGIARANLSVRDWFALMVSYEEVELLASDEGISHQKARYILADRLLEEREKEQPNI